MSTSPRVSSALEGQPPHMVSALMHQPTLARKLDSVYRTVWGDGVVAQRVLEVARMRSARMVDCGACQNVRLDAPRNEGLREDAVSHITDDYEGSDLLTAQEKAAVMLTDAIVGDPTLLSGTAKAIIHENFTDEQIAVLAFEIAKLGAVAKLIITMGMEPAVPPDAMVVPTPGKEHGLLSQDALRGAM